MHRKQVGYVLPVQFVTILTNYSRQAHGVKPFCGVGQEWCARKRIKASGFLFTASDLSLTTALAPVI
jgi:hypothetical protein